MTEPTVLGPSLSQRDPDLRPGGPSSVNDCWVVAGDQAARAVGGRYYGKGCVVIDGMSIATVVAFRGFAHKPDKVGPAGAGFLEDVEAGIKGAYPSLRTYVTRNFDTFVVKARAGGAWEMHVDMSKMPDSVERYGFSGIHAISGRVIVQGNGEKWYHINPLQPRGSAAVPISLGALKRAFMGAVLVKAAPEPPPIVAPPVEPVPPVVVPPVKTYEEGYAAGFHDGSRDMQTKASQAIGAIPVK